MAEYIEREAASTLIKNYGKGAITDGQKTLDPVDDIVCLAKGVDLIPAADVTPVVHGSWRGFEHSVYYKTDSRGEPVPRNIVIWHCSGCGRKTVVKEQYCPNCGAKMDLEG